MQEERAVDALADDIVTENLEKNDYRTINTAMRKLVAVFLMRKIKEGSRK